MNKELLVFNEFKKEIETEFNKFFGKTKTFTHVCNHTLFDTIRKRCEQIGCDYNQVTVLIRKFETELKISYTGNYHSKKGSLNTKGRIYHKNMKSETLHINRLEKRNDK